MRRIEQHPILGELPESEIVHITVDGRVLEARKGEMILSTLLAYGIVAQNITRKNHKPGGYFCGIGRCTGCIMTVNGDPNIRTCITPVEDGMVVITQDGLGKWG